MNDSFHAEQNQKPDNEPRQPLLMGFGFLHRIMPGWMSLARLYFMHCPKYFMKPALLLSLATITPPIELMILKSLVKSINEHGAFMGSDIFLTFAPPLIGCLILSVGALGAVVWGFGALLVVLTATCRTFLLLGSQNLDQDRPAQTIAASQEEGIQLFRNRKGFLAIVWLIYSLFMIVPTIVMFVSLTIVLLGLPPPIGPAPTGEGAIQPFQISIPPELMVPAVIACSLSSIVLSNYALILLAYSALTQQPATKTAVSGLLLTLRTLPAISIYSVIFLVLSTLLSSPIDLLLIYNPDLITGQIATVLFLAVKVVCNVLFFLYFVPISMLIPCEMIRNNID